MHLTRSIRRPAHQVRDALLAACARQGLAVARTHAPPPGPSGRACFVIELCDPLPGVPSEPGDPAAAEGAEGAEGAAVAPRRDVYPLTVFDTEPGRCRVATLLPAAFVDLLGHPEAAPAAVAFERTLRAVLDAADA